MEKTILNLFKYSRGTYYSWKKEQRPIINLIEKYFTEDELEEFLNTGTISKMELLFDLKNDIERDSKKILNFFTDINNSIQNEYAMIFVSVIFIEPTIKISDLIRIYQDFRDKISYDEFSEIMVLIEESNILNYHTAINYISMKKAIPLIHIGALKLHENEELYNTSIVLYIISTLMHKNTASNKELDFDNIIKIIFNKCKISNYTGSIKNYDYNKLVIQKVKEIETEITAYIS